MPEAFSNTQQLDQTAKMRTKFTSGPPVTTHNGFEYTTAGFAETSRRVTHYTNQDPDGPTSTNYQDTEQHLFAIPSLLVGDKLLRLAETYSNKQISDKITATVTGNSPTLSTSSVASRIRAALASRAKEQGITVAVAKAIFRAARKANGVQIRAARVGVSDTKTNDKSALTSDTDESDRQSDAYEEDFGGKRDGHVPDSELSDMTELETDKEA